MISQESDRYHSYEHQSSTHVPGAGNSAQKALWYLHLQGSISNRNVGNASKTHECQKDLGLTSAMPRRRQNVRHQTRRSLHHRLIHLRRPSAPALCRKTHPTIPSNQFRVQPSLGTCIPLREPYPVVDLRLLRSTP